MRAHTRAQEKRTEISPSFFLSFLFFSFLFFYFHFFLCILFSSLFSQIVFSIEVLFCEMKIAFSVRFKEKSAVFLDFFTLWDDFYPYTSRGNVMMEI